MLRSGPFVLALPLTLSLLGGLALAQEPVRLAGSDTMVYLAKELASEFERTNPGQRVDVEGRGSERGISALLRGEVEMAASSRELTDAERERFAERFGTKVLEVVVALDAVAVYVHPSNPVGQLSMEQLAGILNGEIRNWRDVGGHDLRIDIYNRNQLSGTRTFVQSNVLAQRPFSRLAREVPSTSMVMASIARNHGAIGYGGVAYSQDATFVRLSRTPAEPGVWPREDRVAGGEYPLARPLYLLVNPTRRHDDVRSFLTFVLGARGTAIVKRIGFFPAPATLAATSLVHGNRVGLDRANLRAHGFDLKVTAEPAAPDVLAVRVKRGTNGRRIAATWMRLGRDAEVPLAVTDGVVEFLVRRRALVGVELLFVGAEADGERRVFVLPLAQLVDEG